MKRFIVYIALVLIPLYYSILYYTIDPIHCLGIFVGLFVWSMAEYGFHRFAFHNNNLSPATYELLAYNHVGHHENPNDSDDLLLPLRLTVPVAVGLFMLSWILFPLPAATFFLLGLFLGLSTYEFVHWQAHYKMFSFWPLGYLTRRHMKHHYEDETKSFGVTSSLWDRLLGT